MDAQVADYADGMALQNVMARTLFYYEMNQANPAGPLPMVNMADPSAGMDFTTLKFILHFNKAERSIIRRGFNDFTMWSWSGSIMIWWTSMRLDSSSSICSLCKRMNY